MCHCSAQWSLCGPVWVSWRLGVFSVRQRVNFHYKVNVRSWYHHGVCWCRLTAFWTVRGSNPGEGEIFCIHPDGPWCPPSLLYSEYSVSSPWVKRPARDNHLPNLVPKFSKKQSYTSTPRWACFSYTLPFCLYVCVCVCVCVRVCARARVCACAHAPPCFCMSLLS